VQSLRPETLRLFDRPHSVDEAFRAYEAARAAEIGQVSLDLIYGAPAETLDGWDADLRRLFALEPDHVSAYELTLEQDTPLQRDAELGHIQPIDDEQGLALFWLTRELGAEHGYHAYEISNFARVAPRSGAPPGPRPESRCRHNLNYWANGPYLGIGPSAISKRGHLRRGNPRSLGAWAAQVRRLVAGDVTPDPPWAQRSGRGGRPLDPSQAWGEHLEPLARLGETWWLGLRTARGIDPALARRTAGWDEEGPDPALGRAEELTRDGLLERRGERFRLTRAGLPLADAVAARFLDLPGQEQSGRTAE